MRRSEIENVLVVLHNKIAVLEDKVSKLEDENKSIQKRIDLVKNVATEKQQSDEKKTRAMWLHGYPTADGKGVMGNE